MISQRMGTAGVLSVRQITESSGSSSTCRSEGVGCERVSGGQVRCKVGFSRRIELRCEF
jgi:hypothetical protein